MDSVIPPQQLEPVVQKIRQILDQLDLVLLGQPELHRMVFVGILSRGHILLEGVPGVGKTALVKALADLMGLDFKRVQFTPDLMPSDILGSHILQGNEQGERSMTFRPGPVFANILLADEINRASPKTQSALLEAMQERSVTLLGTTRALPNPFFVLASQNPIELEGTYPLPEAQLDRFLFKLMVPQVNSEVLEEIISSRRRGEPPQIAQPISPQDLEQMFEMMNQIFLPRAIARYIARLVAATHPYSEEATDSVKKYVSNGASPRAAIGLAEAARAEALISGRPTVGFDDVKAVANAVLNHRILLNYQAKLDRINTFHVVRSLLDQLDETELRLPKDIKVGVTS